MPGHAMTVPKNCILLGDCVPLTAALPEASVELSLFSPPYDAVRDYRGEWHFDFPTLGHNLYRISKEGGICAVVIGDGTKHFAKSLSSFKLAVDWCEHRGWRLFECCIYHRDGNPGAWWNTRFRVDHEYILLFLKGGKPKYFDKRHLMVPSKHAGKIYSGTDRLTNGGFKRIDPKAVKPEKCRGTVWRYAASNTEGNRLKSEHPATFPDKLAEDLIRCFTEPGAMVLDPMCGSGTSCVVAARHGRDYLGMEISAEYCKLAEQRLAEELMEARVATVAKTAKNRKRKIA